MSMFLINWDPLTIITKYQNLTSDTLVFPGLYLLPIYKLIINMISLYIFHPLLVPRLRMLWHHQQL